MRLNINRKSLKFKIWLYFVLFAALLMLVLWFLQIFFLDTYYEEMKISQTRKVANTIISHYGKSNLVEFISTLSYENDMFIHIESSDGTIIFSPSQNLEWPSFSGDRLYLLEMGVLKEKLVQSSRQDISILMNDRRQNNTLAYGAYLENEPGQEVILYIFSPLYPMESTIEILSNQLKYVTLISLILAFGLSFLISNRISRPIVNITSSATKLAEGDYGVNFEGGGYSEIAQLAETLNYTSGRLAKTDTLQKDLVANVSHDLKTPLTMVKSYAEMIRDLSGDNPEKRNAHLQVIIEEADRLNLLVQDLLMLSRMQSGAAELHISRFCFSDAIQSILNSFRVLCDKEGYRFICSCRPGVMAIGDEARIKQVLSNLINNAIRYGGDDKEITITVTETDDAVCCQVSDNGQGIPEDELEHIWDRYYKSSSNRSRNTEGTGLGLSIVKEILLLHKASYGVKSKLNEGSTFWFELKS